MAKKSMAGGPEGGSGPEMAGKGPRQENEPEEGTKTTQKKRARGPENSHTVEGTQCAASQSSRAPEGTQEEGEAAAGREPDGLPAGSCCAGRRKHRDEAELRDLIHRLNRVEGQIRGIRSMVENDAYCIDILTQVSAAGSALAAFSRVLLSEHVRTCVVEDIRDGRDEKTEELLAVLQKFMR